MVLKTRGAFLLKTDKDRIRVRGKPMGGILFFTHVFSRAFASRYRDDPFSRDVAGRFHAKPLERKGNRIVAHRAALREHTIIGSHNRKALVTTDQPRRVDGARRSRRA
jgi:hypothetical protein